VREDDNPFYTGETPEVTSSAVRQGVRLSGGEYTVEFAGRSAVVFRKHAFTGTWISCESLIPFEEHVIGVEADLAEDRSALLDAFDLGSLTGRMATKLSGGQARRLAVALAFAGGPDLVLLDEPSTGLDIQRRRQLWDRIRDPVIGGKRTVLLTSHYMDEIEALADRVVVILDGKVAVEGTVADIKRRVRHKIVSFVASTVPELDGVTNHQFKDGRHYVFAEDADAFVTQLVTTGAPFSDLDVRGASLEQAFIDIAGTAT
jgi:ABC-2 type transport system ATP-binding protein